MLYTLTSWNKLHSQHFMEHGGSLPHSQQSTTCPYSSQINPFLCPSHFWQAQLVSFLVGLRTYQHPCISAIITLCTYYKANYTIYNVFVFVGEILCTLWTRCHRQKQKHCILYRLLYNKCTMWRWPICRGADPSLARPGKKHATFPAFYGTWRFFTTFTRVCHLSIS